MVAEVPETAVRWVAGQWQRAEAGNLAAWRASDSSLALRYLVTLCQAISATALCWAGSPRQLAPVLPEVLGNCNKLGFDSPDEVAAYALLHLADRYGRVTQVLERLFAAGHLPIRRRRLSVLEIGAGPAPGLYAVRDFYDDLTHWVTTSGQRVEFVPVTTIHALDKGQAWGHLMHHLSENLLFARGDQPGMTTSSLHFGTTYADFTGFSVIQKHRDALEQKARLIADEDWEDPISLSTARQLAQQEGVGIPSAYDLIVACNFLTTQGITRRFHDEIQDLSFQLTPGGLLILLGSPSDPYVEMWRTVRHLLQRTGLSCLSGFANPIRANETNGRAILIRQQMIRDFGTIILDGGKLPRRFDKVGLDTPFPLFRAMVWKNQTRSRSGRKR